MQSHLPSAWDRKQVAVTRLPQRRSAFITAQTSDQGRANGLATYAATTSFRDTTGSSVRPRAAGGRAALLEGGA